MLEPEESNLHELLKNKPSAKDVQSLIDKYPDAVRDTGEFGQLPLHTAIYSSFFVSDQVIHVLLEADSSAAEKTVKVCNQDMLPLHFALDNRRSPDVVKSLLDVYPEGAQFKVWGKLPLHIAIQKNYSSDVIEALLKLYPKGAETRWPKEADIRWCGKLPMSVALTTNGVSDDVVLALLKVYPDAAEVTLSIANKAENVIDVHRPILFLLPLHFAMEEKRSESVVKALINAYPGAAKEKSPRTKNLPLHDAIKMNRSEGILLLLVNAHPQAVKKKMKDGRLPIEACAEKKASEDLMLALLEADMPLRRDGTPVEHSGSWTACVAAKTDGAAGAVRRILSPMSEGGGGFGVHIHTLADTRDAEGRTALGVASSGPRAAIYKYLLFSRRYKLQTGAPEHHTATSVVLRAQDLDVQADYGVIFDEADKDRNGTLDRQEVETIAGSIDLDSELFLKGSDVSTVSKEDFVGICKRQLGDGPRNVVIKLMQEKDHWERECNARKEYNLDPKYVVSALPNIPSETEIEDAVMKGEGGLETIMKKFLDGIKPGKYAIVMDAADRNLHQIFYQERPQINAVRDILRQVFEAVKHLHEKKLMHGDLKMLNIVRRRIDNQLRLIDFDASAKIVPIGGEDESFAGAKFSSAILPPEMIERIETEEQLEKFNKYWEVENDKSLVDKVAPKIYKEHGAVKARYVAKSFRTEEGKPVNGLPYDLVKASASIDRWALGVLAFTLLTGETLIPCTRDDDCASGAAMHVLYSWEKQPGTLSELFKKIHDDAARELVEQLLQYDPEKRPNVASLLEKHPFFNPERNDKEMKDRLERFEKNQENERALMERIYANILVIKKMCDESKAELFYTRHVLLKGMFEATEVIIPTTFIVLNDMLPPSKPSEEDVNKILDIVAAEDGTGVSVESKYASVTLSADGADFNLEGNLKKHYEQFKVGMNWVKRIKSVGSKIAAGEVGTIEAAFKIINEGIKDLIVGKKMYLYLIDELTGEPVRADGWPIVIKKPKEVVPKLLPLMQVGMRAMSIYNGAAGVARMFGYPVPKVPKAWSEGAQESVELLKKESSVEQFAVVHAEVKGGTEMKKSVRGASLREFMDFMNKNDPGLKDGKNGDFAGLQRIGDPEDGAALWTTLADPLDIENALKERASQRREEERKQNEHIQNMAKVETVTTAKERIIDEIRKMTKGMVTAEETSRLLDARIPVVSSEEITEVIKARINK